jgi:ubiquinone/menaquinone biosynthesis C-methylase UbiE
MYKPLTIQSNVRSAYARHAHWYDIFTGAMALGMEPLLRRRLVDKLVLRPGERVLEIACGAGLNFAAIECATVVL